ncbi:MAG: hypothetical protein Q8Q36_00185 [bacterium]|nr:hypothetical protein [bacterium]
MNADGRGERSQEIEIVWTWKGQYRGKQHLVQLTFHEGGRTRGWYGLKVAFISRDGRVGDFGGEKRLTFKDLEEAIEIAKEVIETLDYKRAKPVFMVRGLGGQHVHVFIPIEQLQRALDEGRRAVKLWLRSYGYKK